MGTKGMLTPPSPIPLFPTLYDSHPPQTHSGQMRKQARSMLRCQLPKARGHLLTGQFPQLQKASVSERFNLYAFAGNLRFARTDWFSDRHEPVISVVALVPSFLDRGTIIGALPSESVTTP